MKPLFFKKLVASLLLSAFFISCFFPQVGLALPVLEYFLKDYRDDSYSFQSEISLELGEKNYPTQGAGLSLIATSHGKNSTQDLTIETSFSQEIYSAGRSSLRLSGALSSQLSSADHHIISSLESLEVSSSSQKWQNQIVKSSALFD
ncbi:MAG: hypothetical protein Q8P95_00840, partial [bacterium]|nr:hypothetical protein [bacterium]